MIGFFVNTLVMRTDLGGNPSFRELLRRVRQVALEAYQHQDIPFERLVKELAPARAPGHSPLFQAMFALQAPPPSGMRAGELVITPRESASGVAKFDLTLILEESEHGIAGYLEYDIDLFEAMTARRMAERLEILLESIASDCDRPIAMLPLLSAAERRMLLVEWNTTDVEYSPDACIHALFVAQAHATPDAVAVVLGNRALTYRELDEQSNRLAWHLRSLGVGPETHVGLFVERSLEMVVAVLGILKAGGAYVPLDPEYPAQRIVYILEDARPRVVLTVERLLGTLPRTGAQVCCLDRDWPEIERHGAEDLAGPSNAESLAYLIYTSGSTGRPKAVAIEHRSTAVFVAWAREVFDEEELSGVLASTSLCFDLSVFELFVPLCWGGTVILAQNALALPGLAGAARVRLVNTVPSAMGELVRLRALPAGVRTVNLAGEALPGKLVDSLYELGVNRVLNLYGPSEDTTYSTFTIVPRGSDRAPTIGRPVSNTQVYLLDPSLQPVPLGTVGELYLGGMGLARGYLNRPDLTAERFIPDPFGKTPGGRLYRTGDLARHRSNGELEYLGRMDHQVKIRGFRIELGEIESVLAQHPAVREAVVVAREDAPGDKRLVAYLVAQQAPLPGVSELRSYLQARLPDYMIPAGFIELPALPLSPNGKVDRKALPAPDAQRPAQEQAYVAPCSPVEEALARIWAEVLRLDQVGAFDNFFALGGDSILAIQVISKAQAAGLALSVKQFFQHQTIAALAAVAVASVGPTAEQGPVTGPIVLTPVQRFFFDQPHIDLHHFNQAVLFEVRERLDMAALERAVRHLVQHHDALRLRFVCEGNAIHQANAGTDDTVSVTTVDLSAISAAEQARAIEDAAAQVQGSLRLDTGPLMRVALLDLGPARSSRLLIVIHHLAVDGVSWRILVEDLDTAYHQARRGEPLRLPPKTTSFQQWAERLAAHAQSDAVRSELSYWRSLPPAPALPVDRTAGDNTVASTRTVEVALDIPETRALLQEVPQIYRTQINDVLLLALALALAPWSGTRQVRIDLEGHGREDIAPDLDLSRTVGWFTTIFPVVLELPEVSLGEAIEALKKQLRRIPNHGLGHGLLRYLHEDPAIGAELAAMPRAQVSFNYLGQLDQTTATSSWLVFAPESSGPAHGPHRLRPYQLDINGWLVRSRLRLVWTYSDNLHHRATIEALAQRFLAALHAIIAHCRSPEAGARTRADFPLGSMTQNMADRVELLDCHVPRLLRDYRAAGAGVAIIEHASVVWTGYYGEQGPGVPATAETVFNTASIAKTVTAETLIALASKGLISFDEPIYKYVSDPDLSGDPRFEKLTPRLLLSHRAGLLNWPYQYQDGRAAFVAEPGTTFGYSGIGVELAALYAEKKLGQDFEALAFEYLLRPMGISDMALGRLKPWMEGRLATPMDAEGKYFTIAEHGGRMAGENSGGRWRAADDLLTTVDAYARFLVGVIESAWLDREWVNERTRILTSLKGDAVWDCSASVDVRRVRQYGYGLGWMIYEFDDKTVVTHGGNDKGENALVVYSPETGNGAVIFINGENGMLLSTQILDLIRDQPEIAAYYRQFVKQFHGVDLPGLAAH